MYALYSADTIYALKQNHFKKRGNAFFRANADGVLQIIKHVYEPNGCTHELKLGLFSMYSKLRPEWFTSGGCIPRYSIFCLTGQHHVPYFYGLKDKQQYARTQEEILLIDGLPWLNSIETQKDLIQALCYLETSSGGNVSWVDSLKIEPFLYCNEFASVRRVINAIKEQRHIAYHIKKRTLPKEMYEQYILSRKKDDDLLEYLLQLIETDSVSEIQKYLLANYTVNKTYASFCMIE